MSPDATAPLIRYIADWRAIITFNAYRTLVGFGLVAALLFDASHPLFNAAMPDVFRVACLLYLIECAVAMLAALARRPPLYAQVLLAVGVDVVLFTVLTLASTGVAGGLGMLLIAPLAAAGMLLPGRIAALMAACAAIGILGQEALRPLQLAAGRAQFVQAGILGSLFFITVVISHWLAQRARAGEALAAQRADEVRDLAELNRRIIQRMAIGAIVVDNAKRIELINDAALRLLDLREQDHYGQALAPLAPTLHAALAHWIEMPQAGGDTIEVGQRSLLPLFSRLSPHAGAPILIFLEDAKRQSEQAQQLKLVSIGRLTTSIAHEIRNPLGAISHAGQLLAESASIGADEARLLDIIHRHTRRIDAIVSDVLGLSRRSRGSRVRLALAAWLRETLADYRQYNDRAPEFAITGLDSGIQIEFDPRHLRQVLFNLWDNAQRYARRDDAALRVSLAAHLERAGVFYLEVIDNGPGMDADTANQVMEPFFTTAHDGTGLGLHVARELCAANGATLSASARSGGACFRITFAQVWLHPESEQPTAAAAAR